MRARAGDGVGLFWNDPETILAGGHWWIGDHENGRSVRLRDLVERLPGATASRCVEAHVTFLADLLIGADRLYQRLVEGLGPDVAGAPGQVGEGSPLGQTCTRLAAALDAWVYELALAQEVLGSELSPRATRLVLDAAQVSVYLRSLTGRHRWPQPLTSAS